jgi:flavodoxin I
MKIAIIYTSISGNTKELALLLSSIITQDMRVELFTINDFNPSEITEYDAIIIGTYTWGDGEIPFEMVKLYKEIESKDVQHIVTGVFGTGDSFYPKFCGAVDTFRDMLYVHTNLAVTLKVELQPQVQDIHRCMQFADKLMVRLNQLKSA